MEETADQCAAYSVTPLMSSISVIYRGLYRNFSREILGFKQLNTRRIMVGGNQVLERVEKRAIQAEEMVELLKKHIDCLQKAVGKAENFLAWNVQFEYYSAFYFCLIILNI